MLSINLLFYFNLLYLFNIEVISALSTKSEYQPIIDIYEINNFIYQIEIDKEFNPINQNIDDKKINELNKNEKQPNKNSIITLKSIHGQTYQCQIPKNFVEDSEENNEYDDANILPHYENSFLTTFFGDILPNKDQQTQIQKTNKRNDLNFTLINDNVKKYMNYLKNEQLCVYKNLGWWSYELCFGSHAYQYHQLQNGSILGEKISLGSFNKNFDWSLANTSSYPIQSDSLYHEQYFENGSLCELSQKPRKLVAKIFCDETATREYINLISEIETCVYEVHINSYEICNIPNFKKKSNNFGIKCNPVIDIHSYEKYLKRKEQIEHFKIENVKDNGQEKNANIAPFNENTKMETDKNEENMSLKDKISNEKVKLDEMDKNVQNEFSKAEQTIEENTKKIQEIVNKLKNNLDNENDDDLTDDYLSQSKTAISDSFDQLLKADKLFDKISAGLNNMMDDYNDEMTALKKDSAKTKEIKQDDDFKSLDVPKKTNDQKSTKETKDNEDIDEAGLWKMKVTLIDKKGLLDKNMMEKKETATELKDIEDQIAEKLMKSNKLKFKSNNIKVKIITLDPNGKTDLKSLSDEESNELTSLINSLFESDKEYEKLKHSKLNYNVVYDSQKFESVNLEADNQNDKKYENLNLFTFDEEDSNEDDSSSLIFY